MVRDDTFPYSYSLSAAKDSVPHAESLKLMATDEDFFPAAPN